MEELKIFTKKAYRKIKRTILQEIYKYKRRLNLKRISKISGLEIPKELKKYQRKRISEISLSARDLKPNCIFFCILYSYLTKKDIEKIQKNAKFVVTPKPIEGCKNIICENPAVYGRKILNYLRNLPKVKVVAITGSVGKTSTKEMVESVLRQKYKSRMIASIGNSNSAHKVAYYVKQLSYNEQVYLQEVGAGSLAYDIVKNSAVILEADVAVYTNIRDNHIEWYGSRENIAKEKFTLSDYGKKDGLAIINYDDEILRNHKFIQKTISYSLNNKKADYYAKDIKITNEGTTFTIVDNIDNKKLKVELELLGEHHILNSLVGYIIGKYFNIDNKTIIKGLKNYKTSGARQNLINLGNYKVLADCYNSSYDAIANILKTLDLIKPNNNGKKIAVIGDIFELGDISEKIHREVGILLAKHNIDKVIFQGDKTKFSHEEYKKIKANSIYCKTREELFNTIKKEINQDDIILFKASHGMYFAEAIDEIFGSDIGEVSALGHHEYETMEDDTYVYNIFKNHVTIQGYKKNEETIILPKTYNNLPIKKLGKVVFKENKNIKEITLSDDIVRLRGYSFKNSSLEKINLNNNLKVIGEGTFHSCPNLKEVNINEGLLIIERRAFYNCPSLTKVIIPNSTKIIHEEAFNKSTEVTIYCKKDSYAETYAKKHNIKYENI